MAGWNHPDWLPELEIVEWPRLAELRDEHRRLLRHGTAAAVREHAATAVRELIDNWGEGEAALDAVIRRVRPEPVAPDAEPLLRGSDEERVHDRRRADADQRLARDRRKGAADKAALRRLWCVGLANGMPGDLGLGELVPAQGTPLVA